MLDLSSHMVLFVLFYGKFLFSLRLPFLLKTNSDLFPVIFQKFISFFIWFNHIHTNLFFLSIRLILSRTLDLSRWVFFMFIIKTLIHSSNSTWKWLLNPWTIIFRTWLVLAIILIFIQILMINFLQNRNLSLFLFLLWNVDILKRISLLSSWLYLSEIQLNIALLSTGWFLPWFIPIFQFDPTKLIIIESCHFVILFEAINNFY